ncbi:MAG: hypothetical protein WAW07_12505 [Bacteroidales bacterium]
MKRRAPLLIFALLLSRIVYSQDQFKVTWDYSGQSFSEFVVSAEEEPGLSFFFRDEWVADLKPGV